MPTMIEDLDKLNRKERFFLIGMALGNPKFKLDSSFRRQLTIKFGISVPEPSFVAMDYHLNWIFAAAAMAFLKPDHDRVYLNPHGAVDGTQEDVDLLIAFEDYAGVNHLIMLVAKGVGAFDNAQFAKKMRRLVAIFGENGCAFDKVRPHLGLISPHQPRYLDRNACPEWLKINGTIPWIEMPIPERLVLFGCDEDGTANREREFWTVRHEMVDRTPT
jgi:hypothetical protein